MRVFATICCIRIKYDEGAKNLIRSIHFLAFRQLNRAIYSIDTADLPQSANASLNQALQLLDMRLEAWASNWEEAFDAVLYRTFSSYPNTIAAEALRSSLLGEGLGLTLSVQSLPGLRGAYAAATATAPELVLLDRQWLLEASPEELETVLLEELGHAIDQRLNGGLDSPGDEGEIFSALLRGVTPRAASASENDQRWIEVAGVLRLVEAADTTPPALVLNGSRNPAFTTSSIGFGLPDIGDNASPDFVDIDGDGDLDAFIGNNSGSILFFSNTGTTTSPAFTASSIGFGLPDVGNMASPSFCDIDSDGDLDALIGNNAGETLFFRNTGNATSPAFAASAVAFQLTDVGNSATPTFVDIDADGDLDAFIGNSTGSTLFFRNTGTAASPAFAASSIGFDLPKIVSNASPTLVDIDGDGDLDFFLGDPYGNTIFLRNTGTAVSASFTRRSIGGFGLPDVGTNASPSLIDIDGDGDLDAFIGNSAGSTLFFRNTGTGGLTSSTANGTYGPGTVITILVPFTEVVTVNTSGGTPTLLLETGSTDRLAIYTGGSGSNTLTFSYSVSLSDTSLDLDYASTTALQLNGGTIRDAGGNNAILTLPAPGTAGSLGANAALVIDNGLPPALGTAGITSITANGTYPIGSLLTIRVPFSEIVTVNTIGGTPTLLLETGSTDRTATYSSGSATDTLFFSYTVQAGDVSTDLDVVSTTALQLNGGTIKDGAGNNATLTVPAPGSTGSLGANADVVIDGVVPTVRSSGLTSSTTNGTYGAGMVITVRVPFSEVVSINTTGNTPTLLLETGSTDRAATYTGGSGTDTLSFTYTVQAGDVSTDLDVVSTAALQLNGGTIKDGAGNNATLLLPAPGTAGSLGANAALVIDGVAPTLSQSTPLDGATGVLESANLQLSFSKPIQFGTGLIEIRRGNGVLVESFNVATGTGSAGGVVAISGNSITLNPNADLSSTSAYYLSIAASAIRDAAGNAYAGIHDATSLNFSTSDSIAPTITGISSINSNGTYGLGALITAVIRFSEPVMVTTNGSLPSLLLETGATDRTATYLSGSGSDSLSFVYTVQNGDTSADLDVASAFALALNGATITDAAGNNASHTLPTPGAAGSLGANAALVMNSTSPQSLILASATPSVSEGNSISLTLSSDTLSAGSTLFWTITGSGITAADFTPSSLEGSLSLGFDRRAAFSLQGRLDGVSEGDEQLTLTFFSDAARTLPLAGAQFTLRDLNPIGPEGATDERDLIVGMSSDDVISGVPTGSLLNGRGSFDTLTGNGGNDLFVLGTSSDVYYNDGQLSRSGGVDFATISDFSAGDRIQLKGAATDYRLSSSAISGISGTLVSWRAAAGAGSVDEVIGFVQGLQPSALSLTNSSQFLYV